MRLLREHPGAIEADLQRFYQVDYRDRWRRDEHGFPRLTLRRLRVLIVHLPPESATKRAVSHGRSIWDDEKLALLTHIWQASAGSEKPHPWVEDALREERNEHRKAKMQDPKEKARIAEAKKRADDRRRMIESGEIA